MGYDDVYAAKQEQETLARSCTGYQRCIHINAYYALQSRLDKMTPPRNSGGDGPAGSPAAMQVQERRAA